MAAGVLVLSTTLGVVGIVVALTDTTGVDGGRAHRLDVPPGTGSRLAPAVVVGLVVVAVSGWPLPASVLAAGSWWGAGLWQARQRHDRGEIERIEALASWIENLRDVLIAGDQPIGAITSTVATCPAVIRPQVRRLAAGLGRQEPDLVVRRFADEVDDPIGDLVATGLLIAVRSGARTVGVLSALAEQARAQADRRRLVEAERAPTRREVMLLTAIMGALVAALFVFGRSEYLSAYDDPAGQVFLSLALVGYVALLVRVQRLARFPRPARFLSLGKAGR
ncbi:type II secretion system protein [soil metagenome]